MIVDYILLCTYVIFIFKTQSLFYKAEICIYNYLKKNSLTIKKHKGDIFKNDNYWEPSIQKYYNPEKKLQLIIIVVFIEKIVGRKMLTLFNY